MDTLASAPAQKLDLDRFRLRRFIAELPPEELDRHDEPRDVAVVAGLLDGNPKAVWFTKLGPEGAELVGNVGASRRRIARALGVEPQGLLKELLRRLALPPQIVELSREDAPVQQVVLTGDAIDLTQLPVHLHHGSDGGPYISASIDYTIDPRTGWTNVGFRRLMLRGRTETGADVTAPSDLKAIYEAAVARGERLPVSFVVGCWPTDFVAATMRVPVDELGLVASLRGAPLPVVKCVTNDIRVPADAEYVLEGYLDERGHVEGEGPFGEFLGYYGGLKRNPVFHCTAITRRKDALFQTVTISGRHMANTDTATLETVRTEVNVWRMLEAVVREPVAVYAPVATGGMLSARVALKQRAAGEARSAIMTILGGTNVKGVSVVDADIDIFSDEQMEWAMVTRFQPDRDLVVMERVAAIPLDPSTGGSHTGGKFGFDLTVPFGQAGRFEWSAPLPPSYEGKRFPSLAAALADGPKRFEELVAALGSRDGREVVRQLETMGLRREPDGRYALPTR
ncbi:MAG TPA: UbiD family decarboxylase [Stellaceae bacterium]|nr:UbiD family decarboxylase [Stellaceae bacterium]